jgi:AcrR family transcriptional regulator
VSPTKAPPSGVTRTRRPSAEVRKLILDAAQRLFAENGFRGTSTREIADTAGVAEVLLFRNFGSKAELYSTAVVLPLTEFFEAWLERDYSEWDQASTEIQQREFTAGLYAVVKQHRGLLMSYLAMSVFEPDLISGLEHTKALDEVMDRLAAKAGAQLVRLGAGEHSNPRVGTRAVIGMILSMGLFDDLAIAGTAGHPSSDEVIDEMTQLVLHGSFHRPGPARRATGTPKKTAKRASKKR